MNILFLFVYLPDLSENGAFVDLIKEFSQHGHNVKVVTPLYKNQIEGLHYESGIEIVRFKTSKLIQNKSMIQKGLSYLKLFYNYPRTVFKYFDKIKFDLVISHSLPPEIGLIVKLLKIKYKCKFYLMQCEYIWQDSVALGIFKSNSIICKYYQILERISINTADYIGCPSIGNINFVLKYHPVANNKNLHLLHFSEAANISINSDNSFRIKNNFKDHFIAVYGGNISIAQDISTILRLAENCLEYKNIVFIILGKGPDLEIVKQDAINRGIHNIRFLDFLPKLEYNELLKCCDIGIVSLNKNLGVPNIPSKTISYFSMSLPILASIDYVTDYGLYIEDAGAGLWSYSGDDISLKNNLLKFYQSPNLRNKMALNAKQFYLNNMQPINSYNTIIKHVTSLS